MSDEIKDANLDLLVALKRHLEQTERLRGLFDRLTALASVAARPDTIVAPSRVPPRRREAAHAD